jgi:hypothetical protein
VAVYAANDQQGAAHSIPLATINNIKLFRIIVVACDMNNNLVPSSVSLTPSGGGASQGPLTSVAHNGYGSFTDAQLCGIPGATFPSLSPGTYSLSVGPLG